MPAGSTFITTGRWRRWLPRPIPLTVGLILWLAYFALPAPHTAPAEPVQAVFAMTCFIAAAGASGILGPYLRIPGMVVIAVSALTGIALLNNGHPSHGLYLVLSQACLATGAWLVRFSTPIFRVPLPAVAGQAA